MGARYVSEVECHAFIVHRSAPIAWSARLRGKKRVSRGSAQGGRATSILSPDIAKSEMRDGVGVFASGGRIKRVYAGVLEGGFQSVVRR
jgi:hypothetical protein